MYSHCHVLQLRWVCGERPTARDHCRQQQTDNIGVSVGKSTATQTPAE